MSLEVMSANSMSDAARLLSSHKGSRFFGGGTLLMRAVNEGDPSITGVVRLDQKPQPVQVQGERITLSSTATMQDILSSRELSFLHQAAYAVGGPAVRNMASIGGNLFAPSPYGDFATALLALDAHAVLEGNRNVNLADLFAARLRGDMPLIEAITLQRPRQFAFIKASPVKPKRLSIMAIAASWNDQGGRITGAQVAFGAMGPTPLRAHSVEQALEGACNDEQGLGAAKAVAAKDLQPLSDPIASAAYRSQTAGVWLGRLFAQARP